MTYTGEESDVAMDSASSLDWLGTYLPLLGKGAIITIETLVLAAALTLLVAFVAGFGRLSRFSIVRGITIAYVEIFRGTSLLVQMFWLYFVLPLFGIELTPFAVGVVALGLNYGAYASEVVRSTILAISKGQTEAAIALNMTSYQRMRRVILPQAFLRMLPPFGNLSIELLKGTSLVSLITLADMTYQAMTFRSVNIYLTNEIFLILLLGYFIIALPITYAFRAVERKASLGRN
jgi:polar amino acid transport system permease protein